MHLPLSTCGGAVLFPPGIGVGVVAALFPCPHGMLTCPVDQRGGRDGALQLRGCGEVVARARAHRLLYAARQLPCSLWKERIVRNLVK